MLFQSLTNNCDIIVNELDRQNENTTFGTDTKEKENPRVKQLTTSSKFTDSFLLHPIQFQDVLRPTLDR